MLATRPRSDRYLFATNFRGIFVVMSMKKEKIKSKSKMFIRADEAILPVDAILSPTIQSFFPSVMDEREYIKVYTST